MEQHSLSKYLVVKVRLCYEITESSRTWKSICRPELELGLPSFLRRTTQKCKLSVAYLFFCSYVWTDRHTKKVFFSWLYYYNMPAKCGACLRRVNFAQKNPIGLQAVCYKASRIDEALRTFHKKRKKKKKHFFPANFSR